jgi:hypothetical protein
MSLIEMIYGLLETLSYEVEPEKELHLHFGWPLSSWIDRISIGFMIFKLMRLPRRFPRFHYHIDYLANSYSAQKKKTKEKSDQKSIA